jgi:hypothetical protein
VCFSGITSPLSSFPDVEWVKEFESWELHHDGGLSSVVLPSVHFLAMTTFIWDDIYTDKILDSKRSKVIAIAWYDIIQITKLLGIYLVALIVWLLIAISEVSRIMLYLFA